MANVAVIPKIWSSLSNFISSSTKYSTFSWAYVCDSLISGSYLGFCKVSVACVMFLVTYIFLPLVWNGEDMTAVGSRNLFSWLRNFLAKSLWICLWQRKDHDNSHPTAHQGITFRVYCYKWPHYSTLNAYTRSLGVVYDLIVTVMKTNVPLCGVIK